MWCIQYIEVANSPEQAQAMLDAQRLMGGFIGGRILPKSDDGRPDRMQAFYEDEPDGCWLPDGMSRVFVPPGQLAAMGIHVGAR